MKKKEIKKPAERRKEKRLTDAKLLKKFCESGMNLDAMRSNMEKRR